MLKITANVSGQISPIGEIWIQRISDFEGEDGIYLYEIVRPNKYQGKKIRHRYKDGWIVLLAKALEIMV